MIGAPVWPVVVWLGAWAGPAGAAVENAPAALAPANAATSAPSAARAGDAEDGAGEPGPNRGKARVEHAQAMARLRAGRLDEAAALFARAVEHDPANAAIATDYGFTLGRLGRRDEAERVLRDAIEKDPKRYYAYVNLADLWATDPGRWQRREAAVAFLDQGLAALKDDRKGRFAVLLALAGFERAIGRTATARARLAPLLAPEAPSLSRAQQKRVLDLLDALTLDERAHALEDWPVPRVDAGDLARVEAAEREIGGGGGGGSVAARPIEAIATLDPIVARVPGWARARLARARALEAAGRVDEAARDFEIVVNLAPSNAAAWRALGRLLALHGGALEMGRADEALKQALALEPAWTDLRELRAQIARRRAVEHPPAAARAGAGPSDKARGLFQEAEEWIDLGDPGGFGRDRLEEALADSPGFVAAAVSIYALTGTIPKATVEALATDGPGLWALASGVRALGKGAAAGASSDGTDGQVRAWIDRAVALDVQEARFARAVSRAAAGDREGALDDLLAYVAREPNPEHLVEAQALRAGLAEKRGAGGRPSAALTARIRLLEDQPDAALRALGGACAPDLPADRLLAIGLVHEYGDRRSAARVCYELAAARATAPEVGAAPAPATASGPPAALVRLARLDARLPDAELRGADRRPLARAAALGIPAAEWALARMENVEGGDGALERTRRALGLAARSGADATLDDWIDEARATERRLAQFRRAEAESRRLIRQRTAWMLAGFGALVLLIAARGRWKGATIASALRRRPALFPEVGRAVGELRHDVLKHRAGVLGMVGGAASGDGGAASGDGARAEIARAMLEPRPASTVVAGVYDRLAAAARGAGTSLRPLAREPVFGGIVRDLSRAERLLSRPAAASLEAERAELLAIDARLRGAHADALAELLALGPRTRLDAATLATWVAAVEAAVRRTGGAWTATALALAELDVEFPVEESALGAIFANLLRNAQAAVAGGDDARVIVRVDRARDVTGRQMVALLVGDSAVGSLTLEMIEARESGRGLAIVRDLVRAWRGHLVVRPEPRPFCKLVGASFPL